MYFGMGSDLSAAFSRWQGPSLLPQFCASQRGLRDHRQSINSTYPPVARLSKREFSFRTGELEDDPYLCTPPPSPECVFLTAPPRVTRCLSTVSLASMCVFVATVSRRQFAPWCVWCIKLAPTWEAFAEEVERDTSLSGKLMVAKVKFEPPKCRSRHSYCCDIASPKTEQLKNSRERKQKI